MPVEALTTTEIGMKMVAHALETGRQPPERTLVELSSYPSLEELTQRGYSLVKKDLPKETLCPTGLRDNAMRNGRTGVSDHLPLPAHIAGM